MADDRRGRSETRYCSHCGHSLEPPMNYCPNCGTAIERRERSSDTRSQPRRRTENRHPSVGEFSQTRSHAGDRSSGPTSATRRDARDAPSSPTESSGPSRDVDPTARKQLEARIARATRDGWELEHDFGDHAVMVRHTFGDTDEHLVVAMLTVWWTMGLGNVLYGVYRYVEDAERMVLRAGPPENPETKEQSSHLLERATAAVCWTAGVILALIGLQLSVTSALGLGLLALAFGFIAMGASVLPSVRSRLERRHSLATNGRTRSVEERSVVAYDRPCSACAEPVGRGLERTYRSEFCLLGVPLTGSAGRNYYCQRCANAEFSSHSTETGHTGRGTVDGASSGDASRAGRKSEPESGTGPEPEPEHLD
ncbi:zinc ribbon domain-containing protein [Halopiger aswanensis]|uniref:Zinc ribbon protein n=1 Tax=Halopiger aswanensis TaxID=148449 RepID=A0A3R7DF57_9EURY|nr:zinc ribbon domain-containing protein [Halopiger aswanensis]RKD97656.1 zinc ribbon protein [Halopiger aswanensis]